MYTVEFDKDGVSIVVIDDSGRQGDLQLDISKDDTVHLRQFQEDLGSYAVITLRFKQLMEVLAQLKLERVRGQQIKI